MTKKEAIRQNEQEARLLELGFTVQEANQLRRISMTLHRWYELECGTDSYCLVRGKWNKETASFDYDDDGDAYYEYANGSGRNRYSKTADRETGAKKRLQAIINARNKRRHDQGFAVYGLEAPPNLTTYLQTDPRGAVLYIIRPGDVPEGKAVTSYYDRGICVY